MTGVLENGGQLNDRQRMNSDTPGLQADPRDGVKREVRFDAATRAIYAHDSSNYYRQIPSGVVIPEDGACPDRRKGPMRCAREHGPAKYDPAKARGGHAEETVGGDGYGTRIGVGWGR